MQLVHKQVIFTSYTYFILFEPFRDAARIRLYVCVAAGMVLCQRSQGGPDVRRGEALLLVDGIAVALIGHVLHEDDRVCGIFVEFGVGRLCQSDGKTRILVGNHFLPGRNNLKARYIHVYRMTVLTRCRIWSRRQAGYGAFSKNKCITLEYIWISFSSM